VDEIVRNHDSRVGVERGLFVLVDLGQQGTYLHMRLTLILQHLEFERRIGGIVEVVLHILTVDVRQALLETGGALVKHAKLLVAQRHIVHRKQKYELVVLVFARLNLLQHRLGLLQKDEALFETFL